MRLHITKQEFLRYHIDCIYQLEQAVTTSISSSEVTSQKVTSSTARIPQRKYNSGNPQNGETGSWYLLPYIRTPLH